MRVLYTKEQLETVGINFPTEIKEVRINENNQVVAVIAVESDFYVLPQEPIIETVEMVSLVETDEETESPIMITEVMRRPLLDENGDHKFYYPTHIETDQVDTGEVDEDDQPIFETVETEVASETPIYCYVMEETEKPSGKYLKEVTETIETVIEVEPLQITEDDERWTEDLVRVIVEKEIPLDDEIQSLSQKEDLELVIAELVQLLAEKGVIW